MKLAELQGKCLMVLQVDEEAMIVIDVDAGYSGIGGSNLYLIEALSASNQTQELGINFLKPERLK